MNNELHFRYQLDRSSKKFRCPSCGKKTGVRYIDNLTGEYFPNHVLRCDRENNCGYHYTPKQYFAETGTLIPQYNPEKFRQTNTLKKELDFIDFNYVNTSMNGSNKSSFAIYLQNLFGYDIATSLLSKYFVGRSKLDNGKASIFFQIDENLKVRTGKIIAYNPDTGKRIKKCLPLHGNSVDAILIHPSIKKDFSYQGCFFGQHLLRLFPHRPIAIVESEKTAIICSFYMPEYNWLATGGSNGCKWREHDVFKILKEKDVVLFPDFGYMCRPSNKPKSDWRTCHQIWSDRAAKISELAGFRISVNSILERALSESEREKGYDVADFLIKQDKSTGLALTDDYYPAVWDQLYFALNTNSAITNIQSFNKQKI